MDNYETIYLINETTQLAGNAFMDTLSVIFALMITGYVVGPKLSRLILIGLVAISALFVVPMIAVVQGTLARADALSNSLPRDQFEAYPYLEAFTVVDGPESFAALMMVVSLSAVYAAAVFFIFHTHWKGTITANS